MGGSWPKGFPQDQYRKLSLEGKNALRAQFGMRYIDESPSEFRNRANGKATHAQPAKAERAKNGSKIDVMQKKFPRTTDGAVAFIRAWNSSKDGNEFVEKHGEGNPLFWAAATARATFIRAKGVKLKVLKKSRGEASLYNWDLLKQVAAESGE